MTIFSIPCYCLLWCWHYGWRLIGCQACFRIFHDDILITNHHRFRYWLGAEQATSHYLNLCWFNSLMHECDSLARGTIYFSYHDKTHQNISTLRPKLIRRRIMIHMCSAREFTWLVYLPQNRPVMWNKLVQFDGHIIHMVWRWRHNDMENCPHYWPFASGIHRSPVDSPQSQFCAALKLPFVVGWTKRRVVGGFRRHDAHMTSLMCWCWRWWNGRNWKRGGGKRITRIWCTISSKPDYLTNISRPEAPERSIHYNDVIMGEMASQITRIAKSGADQRKHQSPASLVFVLGIHRWPVNSPHKGPVTRKMFLFDDVIMWQ